MTLGIDHANLEDGDVDPYFPLTSGETSALASVRRIVEMRLGALWWAPAIGFGNTDLVSGLARAAPSLEAAVASAIEQDERVAEAQVTATFSSVALLLNISVRLASAAPGSAPLSLTISLATAEAGVF
jgi:hypothetical protein